MTREDILRAAFHTWGRGLYKKMSLSDIAAYLGVTKPALYRHFRNKNELMEAMRSDFFDRYSARLRSIIAEQSKPMTNVERILFIVEKIADYYARQRDDFIYLFARLLGDPNPDKMFDQELATRGIPTEELKRLGPEKESMRGSYYFAITTCFFVVGLFQLDPRGVEEEPSEQAIVALVQEVRNIVKRGLHFSPEKLKHIHYEQLEELGRLTDEETMARNKLFPAVAEAVAEAGPWNATMKQIARRSGLSKSGLYAHFKSREDILRSLFVSEFTQIAELAAEKSRRAEDPIQRLYLLMFTVTDYLRSRPDFLVALDWLRIQKFDLGLLFPKELVNFFSFLEEEARRGDCRLPLETLENGVRWVFFLVVKLLIRRGCENQSSQPIEEQLRNLHRNVVCGIDWGDG